MTIEALTRDEAIVLFNELFNEKFEKTFDAKIAEITAKQKKLVTNSLEVLKINDIVEHYCKCCQLDIELLKSPSRKGYLIEHRRILYYLLFFEYNFKKSHIGVYFHRDYSSVVNILNKLDWFMKFDKYFKEKIEKAKAIY